MSYLVVDQRVADVDGWMKAFEAAESHRRSAGAEEWIALRDSGEPERLLVIVRFATAELAGAWRARPGMDREMSRVGVDRSSVSVRILDELVSSRPIP